MKTIVVRGSSEAIREGSSPLCRTGEVKIPLLFFSSYPLYMKLIDLNKMITIKECHELGKQLERARKEYNETHTPCTNEKCTFYRQNLSNHCTFYHYVEECEDYNKTVNDEIQ